MSGDCPTYLGVYRVEILYVDYRERERERQEYTPHPSIRISRSHTRPAIPSFQLVQPKPGLFVNGRLQIRHVFSAITTRQLVLLFARTRIFTSFRHARTFAFRHARTFASRHARTFTSRHARTFTFRHARTFAFRHDRTFASRQNICLSIRQDICF